MSEMDAAGVKLVKFSKVMNERREKERGILIKRERWVEGGGGRGERGGEWGESGEGGRGREREREHSYTSPFMI